MIVPNLRLSALIITTVSLLPFGAAPRHDFRPADFARLRWIEGTWQGSGTNTAPFIERYRFINDTTIEMESFKDASMRTVTERNVFGLRNGHIFDEAGKSRREATRIAADLAQFVPVRGASNAVQFARNSKSCWTATIIDAKTHNKTVYAMKRM